MSGQTTGLPQRPCPAGLRRLLPFLHMLITTALLPGAASQLPATWGYQAFLRER